MYKGKRRGAAKRSVRRPARKGRARKSATTGGFTIVRRCNLATLVPNAAGGVTTNSSALVKLGAAVASPTGIGGLYDVPFAFEFHLNDLVESLDLTQIADKYKILLANICVQYNATNGLNLGPQNPCFIEWITDSDDSLPPTIAQANAKMGLRNKGFNSRGQIWMKAYPKVAQTIYNGLTSAYSIPSKALFIDSNYNDVPHYGIKGVVRGMYLLAPLSGTSLTFDVSMKVRCNGLQ